MDNDMHTIEPPDIWQRHLDPAWVDLARAIPAPRSYRRVDDAAAHLRAMDLEGVDVAILYGTHGRHVQMRDDLVPGLADALARAQNDWTSAFCAADPVRLHFAAQIAFHDVGFALTEARRAVEQLGAVAIIGNPNPIGGRHLHDPYFEPLWATIEELDVPIGFHPTGVWTLRDNIARRFLDHPSAHAIATAAHNPIEVMLAFASLAAGGVLERHPRLRCLFLEGTCSWLPWWLWRLDQTLEKYGPEGDVPLSLRPSAYFARQCFIATEPDEPELAQVVQSIGDDTIVFATDYPHSDGLYPDSLDTFLACAGLSEAARRKILWENATRLYPWLARSLS
ncbi:MAG: amidohydrolase family protein [Candidatus Velthaea sp.]